jgi:hypothetical protein
MAKKPEPPPKPIVWSIYKIAAKGVWLGNVEAPVETAGHREGRCRIQGAGEPLIAIRR